MRELNSAGDGARVNSLNDSPAPAVSADPPGRAENEPNLNMFSDLYFRAVVDSLSLEAESKHKIQQWRVIPPNTADNP